jgi:hypothetical protein
LITYNGSPIENVISKAIDSLDNDNKLHVGIINTGAIYICLAQKYIGDNYAAGLVFGYNTPKLLYQTKQSGSWKAVREI